MREREREREDTDRVLRPIVSGYRCTQSVTVGLKCRWVSVLGFTKVCFRTCDDGCHRHCVQPSLKGHFEQLIKGVTHIDRRERARALRSA